MENNKKWSLAHICAYVSLALSVTILVLWCCNAGGFTVVSLDSFVGVIVALLAIVVTLAVGWQIYNSIELKAKVEELNALKSRLNKQEKESKEQTIKSDHLVFASLSDIEYNSENYALAFSYAITSLESAMSLDEPFNTNALLKRMELSASKIEQDTACPSNFLKEIEDNDKTIRNSKCYDMIKTRYEKAYKTFLSKVKEDKDE